MISMGNVNAHQDTPELIVLPLVRPSAAHIWPHANYLNHAECGSLADGKERHPRPEGEICDCKEGWTGINCNVCETDAACANFPLRGGPDGELLTPRAVGDDDVPVANMTCHKDGLTVQENFQMCDVTSESSQRFKLIWMESKVAVDRKIVDQLPGRPPQVTFSCNKEDETCAFQFWVGQKESFYCALDHCSGSLNVGYDTNVTQYECEKIKCQCITGRMLCGEEGSIGELVLYSFIYFFCLTVLLDIGDFLKEDIKGPASFSCTTGHGCKFSEPAMNGLIGQVFGDQFITLNCKGGECLHYTQVPGYVVSPPGSPECFN